MSFILATGFISETSGYEELIGDQFKEQFRNFVKENRKLKSLLEAPFEFEDIDVKHLQKVEAKRRKNNLASKIERQKQILSEKTWKF